jgi:hypothetical protein
VTFGTNTLTATTPTIHFVASTLTNYVATLIVTDSQQNISMATATIQVVPAIPIVTIRGSATTIAAPKTAAANTAVDLTNLVTELGFTPLNYLTYAWTVTFPNATVQTGNASAFSFTPNANGFYVVKLTVTDTVGNTSGSDQISIEVTGAALSVQITNAPSTSPEGTGIVLNSAFQDTVTADTVAYQWSVTKNGLPYRPLSGTVPRYPGDPGDTDAGKGQDYSFIPDAAGTYVVTLQGTSKVNNSKAFASATINVFDVAPTARILNAPTTAALGSSTNLQGSFTDPGTNETETLAWTVNGQPTAWTVNNQSVFSAAF